ncbi:unnamed protein product [Symbiodinium natans]|uniref:Uncharacterized protein n=1 Tax=Symbiodinium natans TaxID=878477 RepID=A0A812II04_9DINO|nr:unnamed protein product [Symbiodinium natans]
MATGRLPVWALVQIRPRGWPSNSPKLPRPFDPSEASAGEGEARDATARAIRNLALHQVGQVPRSTARSPRDQARLEVAAPIPDFFDTIEEERVDVDLSQTMSEEDNTSFFSRNSCPNQ